MEANNLTPQNAEELKGLLEKQLKGNPSIEYRFYEQDGLQKQIPESIEQQLLNMQKSIDELRSKIDLIFGNSVLIDNKFIDITGNKTE